MPDYNKLRDLVSHRVEFEYDSGVRLVGYVSACRPAHGPVQLMELTRVEITDSAGSKLASPETLSLIPNVLTNVRRAEGPAGRDR
jgi:hypothetical protein